MTIVPSGIMIVSLTACVSVKHSPIININLNIYSLNVVSEAYDHVNSNIGQHQLSKVLLLVCTYASLKWRFTKLVSELC